MPSPATDRGNVWVKVWDLGFMVWGLGLEFGVEVSVKGLRS